MGNKRSKLCKPISDWPKTADDFFCLSVAQVVHKNDPDFRQRVGCDCFPENDAHYVQLPSKFDRGEVMKLYLAYTSDRFSTTEVLKPFLSDDPFVKIIVDSHFKNRVKQIFLCNDMLLHRKVWKIYPED